MSNQGIVIQADPRAGTGNGPSRRARRAGRVPAVIYGHGEPGLAVSVDAKAFAELMHHPGLITLTVGGQELSGVIREVQRNPITGAVLHADFQKVDPEEVITITVEIVPFGTPAGTILGGQLEQAMLHLDLKVKAKDMFEQIKVDVSKLELNSSLHVSELPLPEGAKALVDGALPVFHVRLPKSEETEAAEGAEAEPEVIAKGKKEAEGEAAAAKGAAEKKKK
ncbi:MAG: 50S ribosomal protein L25 [Lentisphaeria bacterium]|jgi:large subunit ribosomal protein L25